MGPKTLLEKEERIKAIYKYKQKLMGSWDSNCSGGNQNPRHELLRNEIDTGEQGGCREGTRVRHQGRVEAAGELAW